MSADPSAYAVLGLQPGADKAAVEAAYRRLIKRHHPDRAGGSSERAAEINRAYFELRGRPPQERHAQAPASVAEAIYARRAAKLRKVKRAPSVWPPLIALALVGFGVAFRGPLGVAEARLNRGLQQVLKAQRVDAAPASLDRPSGMDGPLHAGAIQSSIGEARRLVAGGDPDRVEEHSRRCHRRLREEPRTALLDRCAAFDTAVVALARRDPLHDEGPFSASAVTARQMTAARLLSDDVGVIEMRLDQIRRWVEVALAPPPPAPPADSNEADQTVETPLEERLPE